MSQFTAGMVRISSYGEVDEILRNPLFESGRFEEESLPFRGHTLLEINGAEHRQRRKTEIPLVAKAMLDRHEREILGPVIERSLAEADAGRRPDGVVAADLAELSHRLFLQVAAAVIGLDDIDAPGRTDLLESCMYRLNDAFDVKFSTRDHDEVVAEGLVAKAEFVRHFIEPSLRRRRELVAHHRADEAGADALPTDLLTLMVRHHDYEPDSDLITREAILYMAGATDTTSNAVNHAIADLDSWLAEHVSDRAHTSDRAFLRGVCNEALRLHPNVTALARRATEELKEIARKYGSEALEAMALTTRSMVSLAEENAGEATRAARGALRLWQSVAAPYEAAEARVLLASAHRAEGKRDDALLELEAALGAFERLGAALDAGHVRSDLEALGAKPVARASGDGRQTKTFMFTDIVRSTKLVDAIGDDAWADLVRWHDETLRSLFAGHQGEEIDHAGDGFFIAFPTAAAAVECAVAIQRKLGEALCGDYFDGREIRQV